MFVKDTEQLENEIAETDRLEKFFEDNSEDLKKITLAEYLETLLQEKNLSKAEVAKKSEIGEYIYHIFSGRKGSQKNSNRKIAREKILSIAISMQLSLKETQRLLYFSGNEKLYARNSWDGILIYALENKLSLQETNETLSSFSESPLLGVGR